MASLAPQTSLPVGPIARRRTWSRRWRPRALATLIALMALAGPLIACDDPRTPGGRAGAGIAGRGGTGGSGGDGGSGSGTGGDGGGGAGGSAAGDGGVGGDGGAGGAGGEDDAPIPGGEFGLPELAGAAADCAIWQYCRAEAGVQRLRDAVRAYAEQPSQENLSEARAAWRAAMARWSAAELFQFGPAASVAFDGYHGRGLRNLIYAWPNDGRCPVEEQLVRRTYLSDGFDAIRISARGLTALEYLLFYMGNDTACPASSTTAQQWAALDAETIGSRKRDYAHAMAEDLLARVQALHETWKPSGGNFRRTLVTANGYPDLHEALNVVAWGLVYVEREVKDFKLAPAAGVSMLVVAPEAPYSQTATENLRANLRGFRSLFQGCGPEGEGIGFYTWLQRANHSALADDMLDAWRDAQALADAFPGFHQASRAQFEQMYAAVKRLADLLKTEFFGTGSALNLKIPPIIGEDTD
jgi:predicted lipoprotein